MPPAIASTASDVTRCVFPVPALASMTVMPGGIPARPG